MKTLMKQIETKLNQKIKKLSELGAMAKQFQKEKRDQAVIDEVHLDMAKVCNELRPVESVFKALYPVLAELYDNLIKLYDFHKAKSGL